MSSNKLMTFNGSIERSRFVDLSRIVLGKEEPVDRRHVDVERSLTYRFFTHYHPYASRLVRELVQGHVEGLQDADTRTLAGTTRPELYDQLFEHVAAATNATPYTVTDLVDSRYPVEDLDFSVGGAYAVYNWELFFHIPLAVAIHLSQNQRFEEAQRWFHLVFDPTDDSEGATPNRFWRVRPLQRADVPTIADVLVNLSTQADPTLYDDTVNSIRAWIAAPFRPYVIARYRHTAYMYKVVAAYLDNLIAWGDSLFRQDTGEAINEATQVYVLAANLLGPRPQAIPELGTKLPQTYASLRGKLNKLGNALVDLESELGLDIGPHPGASSNADALVSLRSIGQALYFCVPPNSKLLGYWDTVADRLFKIRNSLDIHGVFRQLPLFEPRIDPALLVKAAAAGLDVGAVVAGLARPHALIRCTVLLQKATELAQEVKSLGNQLLSAIEKGDGEAMAILRARQERAMAGLAESVRYAQYQESIKAKEGIERNLDNVAQRFSYYEQLLGSKPADVSIPELEPIDVDGLLKRSFRSVEPPVGLRELSIDIAETLDDAGGQLALSSHESIEQRKLSSAHDKQVAASSLELVGGLLGLIPQINAHLKPIGVGASTGFGGVQLSRLFSAMASATKLAGEQDSYEAAKTAKLGGFARRQQEWTHARNTAAGELMQLFKQLRAAEIREAIAKREWENQQQQIKHAEEIEEFLTDDRIGKKTNQAFYAWMKREVKNLYGRSFQLAFDVAKQAERALQHELGDSSLAFIEYSYLAGKEGLLAGDKLYFDVKRMEMAYHEQNRREYELSRHVSLLELDPHALVALRVTGECTISIPEALFDLDCPGHYFRRLRSVAVSLPCVAGPYAPVPCTLTLLGSTIRTSPQLADGAYDRQLDDDQRFDDQRGAVESVVTSSGQNDAGLFEVNPRDERYLPFEYAGAVSEWRLRLPNELRAFDYETISDVVLHLRYTAREGGDRLRTAAIASLQQQLGEARAAGCLRMLSVRHEFPSEWARLKNTVLGATRPRAELTLTLRDEHYPFWSRDRTRQISDVHVYARDGKSKIRIDDRPDGTGKSDTLGLVPKLGGLRAGKLANIAPPAATGAFSLYIDDTSMSDLLFVLACSS